VTIRAGRPAVGGHSRQKCRSYSKFVERSRLSVGRAPIVGVTFLSRFGLLNPPIRRGYLLARLWRASRLKCRSYRKFVERSGLRVGRARIVGVTFLSRFGLVGPP